MECMVQGGVQFFSSLFNILDLEIFVTSRVVFKGDQIKACETFEYLRLKP